ncbi:MAG: DUF4185 domain-containing protein [Nocardiopsaceae bacterium]|jgi:hypothetical protein|nr:DUF4185 domain-containing protein [Nocardiopsaceae bacterium]
MAYRVRKPELALALCVFVVAFGLTLGGIILVWTQLFDQSALGTPALGHKRLENRLLAPAALDRQWITYSNKSTCADRSGGDGVAAVRLSSNQLAWFFSDSSLGPAGPTIGFSRQSGFVHNLVVIQTIRGSHSKLVTVTGGGACPRTGEPGRAVSVVRVENAGGAAKERYWGADGLRIGSHVLRFYNRFQPGRVPFVPDGTVIADFPVSRLSHAGRGPAFGAVIRPHITKVRAYTPYGIGTPIIWGAALMQHNGKIYIYGWRSPDPASAVRECYLARVDRSRLLDISAWQFYAGAGRWAAGQAGARPIATGADLNIDTGFSVVPAAHRYWLIQHSGGLGSARIDAYPGPRPWGPFSTASARLLYSAPGISLTQRDRYRIMYEARVEPALSNKHKLVISYNVNSLAVTAACVSITEFTNTVIQPHFVAIPRSAFSRASPGSADVAAVAAAPRDYPPAAGDGRRWYDSWKYPGGCPPR